MKVAHHLDDATLMQFASGELDEAFSTVVAAHLEACSVCRENLRLIEACAGQLLHDVDAVSMDAGSLDAVKQRIHTSEIDVPGLSDTAPATASGPRGSDMTSLMPRALSRHFGSLDDVAWKSVVPGIKKYDLPMSSDTPHKLYMLHIAPGTQIPEHGHGGAEMTVVLSGSFSDKHGHFGPGDIADLDEHDEHQPEVDSDIPCICLVAAEGQTKPKTMLARLLQPFIRI